MIKISTNFCIEEFVPPTIFQQYGKLSTRFISPTLPKIAEFLRGRYGKSLMINDWVFGGKQYTESGFRLPDFRTGAKLSAHKRGMAIDVKFKAIRSKEIEIDVLENKKLMLTNGITVFETGTNGWSHFGCEWTNLNELLLIKAG